MTPEDHSPLNYDSITSNIWIGTNMCCHMHAQVLTTLGFDVDIDLEETRSEEPPQTKAYLWLPTPDHSPSTPEQLSLAVAVLRDVVRQKLKVYVHCKNGHGRSPTLVAAYLVSTGLDADSTVSLIKSKRRDIHLQDSQWAALRQFSERAKVMRY